METTSNNHVDFFGKMALGLMGFEDIKFTPRVVNCDGAKVVQVHVYGVNTADGSIIDMNWWPRNNATLEFVESLPKTFDDIVYRVGYYVEVDPITKQQTVHEAEPKLLYYIKGGKEVRFDGDKAEWDEVEERTIYSNDKASEEEESES